MTVAPRISPNCLILQHGGCEMTVLVRRLDGGGWIWSDFHGDGTAETSSPRVFQTSYEATKDYEDFAMGPPR